VEWAIQTYRESALYFIVACSSRSERGLGISQGTVSKGDFRNVEETERCRLPRDDHISLTDVFRASADNP
jgi:hypothetical protein